MLDAGNSGTGYYCCTWLASSIQAKSVMTGDYQICYRPAGPLVETANALGAKIVSTRDNGLAPLWIKGGIKDGQHYHAADFVIPGDWGSSGYPAFAAAITNSTATFLNLNPKDYAGEKEFINVMRNAGCTVELVEGCIRMTGSDHLKGQVIDCSGMPDAVPILAVYGCACKEGKTVLTNIRGSRLNYSVPAAPGSMGPLYLGSAVITVF